MAATWATMRFHGKEKYRAAAKAILTAAGAVADGIRALQAEGAGVKLYGAPDLCVVAFGPDKDAAEPVDNSLVFEAMSKRGWNLNNLQRPANMHLCITYKNAEVAGERFVSDLRSALADVKSNPGAFKGGMGAVYGMAESVPVDGPIEHLSKTFLSALYAVPKGGDDAPYWYEQEAAEAPAGAAEGQ